MTDFKPFSPNDVFSASAVENLPTAGSNVGAIARVENEFLWDNGVAWVPMFALPPVPDFSALSIDAKLQSFSLRLVNDGGTLKHQFAALTDIAAASTTLVPAMVSKINSPSDVLIATPTGADSTTAMAGGGKISSGIPNRFIVDVAAQEYETFVGQAQVHRKTVSGILTVGCLMQERDVNGVTQRRLELNLRRADTNADFALSTGNIGVSQFLVISFWGYIK